MIRIEQINREALKGIEMVEPFASKFGSLVDGSVSLAAYEDDAFIGCAGLTPIGDKWEIWISLPKKTKVRPFTVARAVYDSFQVMKKSVTEEITSHVVDGFEKGEKMVRFLGFRKSGKQLENDGIIYNEYEL